MKLDVAKLKMKISKKCEVEKKLYVHYDDRYCNPNRCCKHRPNERIEFEIIH